MEVFFVDVADKTMKIILNSFMKIYIKSKVKKREQKTKK